MPVRKIRPVAVLISDVHYSLQTLELADSATKQAIAKANELRVKLVVAGDLHDTKANMRGECVKAMIETFQDAKTDVYILRGNHDQINERSEEHSLEFLNLLSNVYVIDDLHVTAGTPQLRLIPYQHDLGKLREMLSLVDKGSTIIMHQGIQGSDSGEYIQDRSALMKEDVADFRVISGHYHRRQDIKCGRPRNGHVGMFSYVGNPYSLGFGESDHPEKGFQILYDDGSLEFVPTNLREHRVITCGWDDKHQLFWGPIFKINKTDILWIKVEGTFEQLKVVTKDWLRAQFEIPLDDFRLELIPDSVMTATPEKPKQGHELLDHLIDYTQLDLDQKSRLKDKWKHLIEEK